MHVYGAFLKDTLFYFGGIYNFINNNVLIQYVLKEYFVLQSIKILQAQSKVYYQTNATNIFTAH